MHRSPAVFPAGLLVVLLVVLLAATLPASDATYSDDQAQPGPVVVRELSVGDGRIVFRVASGGCTDASSFVVDVEPAAEQTPGTPHFQLTIRRTVPDRCKAFLPDGVEVTLELGRDAGLSGRYTVAVANPVLCTTEPATSAVGQ
jgi:hypothetical protein